MPRLVIIVTCACALLLPATAAARPTEIGVTDPEPAASCPDNCQAIGQVTGYQVQQGDSRNPFRVNGYGKIVAFTVTLGNPRQDQIDFFTRLFGGPPQVRLTVLREGARRRARLTGQSKNFEVSRYFGSSPTFLVDPPLTVKPKYVVALTVPTWAPAFSVGLGATEAWRSSRNPDRCDDVRQNAAQDVRGSLRTYGCLYRTARLLYSATYVPDPKPTRQPTEGEQQPQDQQ
jgi:hypothetical protein